MTPDDNTPETLLRMALANPEEAHGRYPDYRLTRLVMARFDMDDAEALAFARLTGRAEDRDEIASPFREPGTGARSLRGRADPCRRPLRRTQSTGCADEGDADWR